ncbi:hypothetical protein JT358_11500 [Micrococcales bacterium 31B]|nr:hypothetical protein [Micrococcales bacterium 31B]
MTRSLALRCEGEARGEGLTARAEAWRDLLRAVHALEDLGAVERVGDEWVVTHPDVGEHLTSLARLRVGGAARSVDGTTWTRSTGVWSRVGPEGEEYVVILEAGRAPEGAAGPFVVTRA